MAGHSHWANIAHKKGIVDAKRGKVWSKLSRLIIVAAKHGGGDPVTNLKLRYVIDKARSISMPKDNIERAIKRGTGEGNAENMEEVVYEGFGPAGVAVMVETLTDKRSRTVGEIRMIFDKNGGQLGGPGSVAYMFERKGYLLLPAKGRDEDALLGLVLEAGADDLRREGDNFAITCEVPAFMQVQEALEKAGMKASSAELAQLPKTPAAVDAEAGKKVVKLLDALDDHDDVQNVYTNADITEEMTA